MIVKRSIIVFCIYLYVTVQKNVNVFGLVIKTQVI